MAERAVVLDLRKHPIPSALHGVTAYGPVDFVKARELAGQLGSRFGDDCAAVVPCTDPQALTDLLDRDQLEQQLAAAERRVEELRRRLGEEGDPA